jgi:CRP-like cAMP-binding protein
MSAAHSAKTEHVRDFVLAALSRRQPLSPEEMQAVRAGLAEVKHFHPGAELIAEGKPAHAPHLLVDGWAVRQRVLSDGRRQILAFVLPGDPFGLCADHEAITSTGLFALTPVSVAPLPLLAEAMRTAPHSALGRFAWNSLRQDEEALCNQVVRMGRQSAYERLIGLLLELHGRLAQVKLAERGSFTLPITQEVLSDTLGLSSVHTNRILQQLKREQLIECHGSTITLANMTALARIADYKPVAR